jgi:hypothetical protein
LFHLVELFRSNGVGSLGAIAASEPAENVEARTGPGEDGAIAIEHFALDASQNF